MNENSPWGMVLHSASEWDVNELYKGRVAFLRVDFPWSVLQPTESTTTFAWLYFDRLVRYAVDRGMWILGGLYGTPEWAVDADRMNADRRNTGKHYLPLAYPAKELVKWDHYVRQVVTRYSARGVRYWSIWNEPDSFNEPPDVCFWRGKQPEFLDGVFQRAFDILRTFPGVKICLPDLAKSTDPGPWLNPILQRAGRNIFAVAAHVYYGSGDGSDVVGRAATTRRIVDSYNASNGTQIQLWITETGWGSTEGQGESAVAGKLADLVREVRSNPWVRKVFPYVWVDDSHAASFKSSERTLRARWYGYANEIGRLEPPPPPVPFERDSLLLSHNVPQQLARGQTYNIQMRFRNIGRWEWKPKFSLGFGARPTWGGLVPGQTITEAGVGQLLYVLQSPQPSTIARPRVALPVAVVPNGGEVTFSFPLTVPSTGVAAGVWLGWGMVHEPDRAPDTDAPDSMFFGHGLLQWVPVG